MTASTHSVVIVGTREEEETILRRQIADIAVVLAVEPDPQRGAAALRKAPASIAVLYLDHDPQAVLEATREISQLGGCASIVVSRDRNPDTIVRAMRSGVRDFAYLEHGDDDVRRALTALLSSAPRALAAPAAGGTVTAVFSCKGGSGATTIASNLAGALLGRDGASAGDTALVDLDFQMGDTLVFLDLQCHYNFKSLLADVHRLDKELLDKSLATHSCGLHVLAQTDDLEGADEFDSAATARCIDLMRRHHAHVVIDGLRDLRDSSLAALDAADRVLLVLTQDVPALKNAHRCLNIFTRLGYERDKILPVINRFQKRSELDRDAIGDALGHPVAATISNDFPTVVRAINEGALLTQLAPRARVTRDICELVPLLCPAGPAGDKRGFLKGWVRR